LVIPVGTAVGATAVVATTAAAGSLVIPVGTAVGATAVVATTAAAGSLVVATAAAGFLVIRNRFGSAFKGKT
jgi:hypothetical protein